MEFWYLGRRPGICILGGQGEGVRRVEDGSAGGQRGGKNGLSLSPPSLSSSVSCSLSLSLPLHVFSCSSCRSPHSLSQGHTGRSLRDHFWTPTQLGQLQPAEGHTGQRETKRQKTHQKRLICKFSCISSTSYSYTQEICLKQRTTG